MSDLTPTRTGNALSAPLRRISRSLLADPLLLLTLLTVVVAWFVYDEYARVFVFDDAYITYRYAQNAASGNGLVFNPGEHVLGTSSPLLALILGLVGALGLDIARVGGLLYLAMWVGVAFLGAASLRRLDSKGAAALFVTWLFLGLGGLMWFWGMETTLYCTLLLASVHCAREGRDGLAGAAAGLAILARYDGGVGALVLGALLLWQRRRMPWRYVLAGCAAVLPWILYALWTYGSLLPQTLEAKAGSEPALSYMTRVLDGQMNFASPLRYLADLGWPWARAPLLRGTFFLLVVGGIFAGSRRLVRRDPWALTYGVTATILWIAYGRIGPPPEHQWHMAPAAILVGLFCVSCWSVVVPSNRWTTALVLVVGGFALVLLPRASDTVDQYLHSDVYRNREGGAYLTMARWINATGSNHLMVMTSEPGYLSYLTQSPVVDRAGLVTEGLFLHGPAERRSSLFETLKRFSPDLYVGDAGTPPDFQLDGYLTVFRGFASHPLMMRREIFEQNFDALSKSYSSGRNDEVPRLSGAWTIDANMDSATLEDLDGHFPNPVRTMVGSARRPVFSSLRVPSPWFGMETPVFLIDADRLEFQFQGTHKALTVAQLIVDGQVVLQQGGMAQWRRGKIPELQSVVWPLSPWRGRSARLRFVDVAPSGHRVMVASISTVVGGDQLWESFEDDNGNLLDRWRLPPEIGSWSEVARERGLGALLSDHAASTLTSAGSLVFETEPFELPASLSFFVFDRCPRECRVELEVDGSVRRVFVSTGSNDIVPVVWDLTEEPAAQSEGESESESETAPRALQGQRGVFRIIDDAPALEVGLMVDDISLRPMVPPAARVDRGGSS